MACPECGCKVAYQYDDGEDDFCTKPDSGLECCAACGLVFDIEDHTPEDDDGDLPVPPSGGAG